MSGVCPAYYNVDMPLRTLGGLELVSSPFARSKPLLLLCYLALEGPKERRHLAELFWQEATDPLNRLAVTLARLRKADPSIVGVDKVRVWTGLSTDAQELLKATEQGRYEVAIALYRGPFLEGVYANDWGSEVEEWVYGTRDFLATQVKVAHLVLAEAEAGEGRFQEAAKRAEAAYSVARTAGLEPSDIARLHTLLLAGGSPHAVTLRQEAESFGVNLLATPDAARGTLKHSDRIRRDIPSNLPGHTSSFVGRDLELAQLANMLADEGTRLITVVGPAGVGKTRLALEAARQQLRLAHFADGVFFAPLDALSQASAIPNRLAETLGVPTQERGSLLLQLQRYIGTKTMLLVLDNFEHLLDGMNFAAELLQACPQLKLLVTSRERLNLKEEWLFPVEGLSFAEGTACPEHLLAYGAVNLFCQRAKQAHPAFTLTEENASGVGAICRLVEGFPLGLELAAAWVRIMPCADIAEEIAKDLDFLAAQTHNVAERHRSLRAAFEYSWRLLTPEEQKVLRQLSVFRGGFSRDAAAEVTGATIPMLASLLDKSLLRVNESGRFDRHPLLYGYTQEKLAEHPEEKVQAEAKHAAYFSNLAQRLEVEAEGSQPRWAYLRLEAELENYRAAWRWAINHKSAQTFDACGKALGRYFFNRGHVEENIELLTSALSALDEADPSHQATMANLMAGLGYEYAGLGRLDEAEALAEHGLALLRQHRGKRENCGMFSCLLVLVMVALQRGRFQQAIAFLQQQEALGLFHSKERYLNDLGLVETRAGNYPAAKAHLERALELNRKEGNSRGRVMSLILLGDAHLYAGEAEAARSYYWEAAKLVRQAGLGWGNDDYAFSGLGRAALELGDLEEAQRVARELLERHPSPDDLHAAALELLGRVATAQGHYDQAEAYLRRVVQLCLERFNNLDVHQLSGFQACLLPFSELWVKQGHYVEAAANIGFLLHHLHDAYARAWAERFLGEVRLALSPEALEVAMRRGRMLSLETVVRRLLASD